MTVDWGYLTIIGVYVTAMIGYSFHDGSDPWTAADGRGSFWPLSIIMVMP